jgi:glycosyltransferase involved in cell wall biosynthesis
MIKLLIVYGSKGKFFHMKEFADSLTKHGIECKLIKDIDYARGFPSKNIKDWFIGNRRFKKLITEFLPDAVFIDRQTHFGLSAIKSKLPLFILLRGHYWSEVDYAKQTLYKDPLSRLVIWFRNRIAEKCFANATAILPICTYLEKIVNEHHPAVPTRVFFEGINSSHWYYSKGMNLEHPCVGLLQDANWWGKTKEMLTLEKVLDRLPNVNFYWAGDGIYKDQILATLGKHKNFHWLGRIQYPDKVREYLSEIDIYALVTGMDTAPLTLKEAQLMERPVIATDVGGVYEMMENGKTGFLVKEGDHNSLTEKINVLINDNELCKKMGKEGKKFVETTFNWDRITIRFIEILNKHLKQ